MTILTVTAKGQVTLRKELLAHLGVHPGDKLEIQKLPDGRVQLAAARPGRPISDIFGLLERPENPTLSIEDLNAAAQAGWAGQR